MSEYISKQQALNAMCHRCAINCSSARCADYRRLAEDIAAVPPADVKPVVYGKWEMFGRDEEENYLCSVCRFVTCVDEYGDNPTEEYLFCPNCGADMRPRREEQK